MFGCPLTLVPDIKNPISLASLVLEQSRKPLSLRRVPPSLLVGEGAKDFAAEHNMPLVPNAWLVSKNAHDRYTKWEQDLKRAEAQDLMALPPASASSPAAINNIEHGLHPLSYRDHAKAIQTGVWNEGQSDSPDASPPCVSSRSSLQTSPLASPGARSNAERSLLGFNLGARKTPSKDSIHAHTTGGPRQQGSDAACDFADTPPGLPPKSTDLDYFSRGDGSHADLAEEIDQDLITDTVGAIAIDQAGHIAAASSSGGIGMKHRGRVGPAALVGVGTSVIPQDEWDEDGVSIAAVTSGTGEHMATTMASQKCAERLYQWTKRGDGGADAVAEDETTILDSFICNDFQKHPGVRNSTSAGAIGVMAVKKSNAGFYLYFAHNTDSFALASMASTDREPLCVMSRLREHSHGVSQGARKIHIK